MFQQRTTRFELLTQHEVINRAIQKRDPIAARQAVEAHLDYVARSQKNQRDSDKNEKIAQQRFEHEKLRR
jgi:GntR family transcriptional repressor for pyruvate dehydrogenase complex